MTSALFIMTAFGINTGELVQLCLASWAGYGIAKGMYYNMAKSDHQIQLLQQIDPNANGKINEIIASSVETDLQIALGEDITQN